MWDGPLMDQLFMITIYDVYFSYITCVFIQSVTIDERERENKDTFPLPVPPGRSAYLYDTSLVLGKTVLAVLDKPNC